MVRFEQRMAKFRMSPSEDEFTPQVSRADLLAHSKFPFSGSVCGKDADAQRADSSGNPASSRRVGSTPDAHSPRCQKVSRAEERQKGDQELAANYNCAVSGAGIMVTTEDKHVAHAGRYPVFG